MEKLQSLRGMVDLLPAQSHRWQRIEAVAREHFRCSGFAEIRTPLLEPTELFARGIGEATVERLTDAANQLGLTLWEVVSDPEAVRTLGGLLAGAAADLRIDP